MNTSSIRRMFASSILIFFSLALSANAFSDVKLEKQIKVADDALYFNGKKVGSNAANNGTGVYDYKFGGRISAHGDAIKVYKNFIFTTWYRGDKFDRHMMLSRYNTKTGVVKTIEFPHRHTGLNGKWWIGESHNTIAVGISPKDEKIHLLFDMHSYANSGAFKNDYFRYAYTVKNAASVPDKDFTLSLFVKDGPNDYNHVSLNGQADPAQFQDLTYPYFFLNGNNDLLMHMRVGGNDNGAYVFAKYNAANGKWDRLTRFNHLSAKNKGQAHNWGLYGRMKYVDGKLRVAFQRRSGNKNDKYEYQNGIYYAYSDDQSGKSQWKDHTGKSFNIPFANADIIKIYEPGNLVPATGKNEVYIVGGFDFTVTDRGDVHIISKVRDKKNNITKNVHSYKPKGASKFTHSTQFSGADKLYTYGNNVYIIGLKNGRPFVQQTDGGKNSFTTLYQSNSGQSFAHGVPHIYNGKLYYYLQAKGNSTKLPVYIQIIDLGFGGSAGPIDPEDDAPAGYTFSTKEGGTVNVTGTMNVAYGAQGEFYYHYNQTSDLACSNVTFGDPKPRVVKNCYVKTIQMESSTDQCDTTNQCKAEYSFFEGAVDCAYSGSNQSICMCGDDRCDLSSSSGSSTSSSSSSSTSSSSSSSSGGAYCAGVIDVNKGVKREVNLNNANCVMFSDNLAGRTLQVWDSDNASCDFRGVIESRDGAGNLSVRANYHSSQNFNGRVIRLTPNNGCQYVQVRIY